jgi:TolB-like protein/Flp pilus assembly protein TadD
VTLRIPNTGGQPTGHSRGEAARRFFVELKRRKVYRVAAAYVVVGWLLIQVTTQVFPFFGIPSWVVRLIVVLLGLGFPAALVLAWAFDLTPAGLIRTEELESAGQTRASLPKMRAAPEKSIAVLPFENLSDDRENAFFADGVHDDILSSLARIADLKVISRTSVQQYKTGVRNLREIGEVLGVAHVLEGTVRRAGNRVRVNAQLIDARTDDHIWADSFDRELTDLFAIQSELAERIVKALRANLSPVEKAGLQVAPTTSLEAHELYLRARDLFHWSGIGDPRENGEKALPLIAKALALDPQFALAYCLASRVHAELYWFGYDKSPARLTMAKEAAHSALRIRPEIGEAHLALAFYHYYAARDYETAVQQLTLAQRAIPNDAEVSGALGIIDRRRGRWEESILHLERARQLDPRNTSTLWNLIETYIFLRRYEEADRVISEALEVSPEAHLLALARADQALRAHGDPTRLRIALGSLPAGFDPGGAVTTIAVRVALMERDYDEADRWLSASSQIKFNNIGLAGLAGALDDYTVSRSWYKGLIARGRGLTSEAAHAFGKAREVVLADLAQSPDDPKTLAMLGLIQAMLGQAAEAISAGQRAVQLLPISDDALDGPLLTANLSVIYARLGERERALIELERIVRLPGGPTPGTLRIEPEWDSLRDDPRFQKLLAA